MPWNVRDVVEQRTQFLVDYDTGEFTMAELSRMYGISRQTAYQLLRRREQEGAAGIQERSRAPRHHRNQTPGWMEEIIVELRRKHGRWGARKLKAYLNIQRGETVWPAASTMGELLRREGLTVPRRKRRRAPPYSQPLAGAEEPNMVWCVDFKGHFHTANGERIDPLTLSDAYSRFLLRCQAVDRANTEQVKSVLEAAFREYGLPQAMRSDNGTPFASRAIAGLSRLSVYLMKLGIVPERIQPGHPEQNGRHERMHRTLKAETASPPASTRRAQQKAFDRFRREYNQERPHQALHQQTPQSYYSASPRTYPARVPEPEYASGIHVRRIQKHGEFKWKHQPVFLTESLAGESIGLEPLDDRYFTVYFATFPLGRFDSHTFHVAPLSAQAASLRENA